MNTHQVSPCDDLLLSRYQDGQLDAEEKARVEGHLAECAACRKEIELLSFFSHEVHRRIDMATDEVDFPAIEKAVIVKALRQRRAAIGSAWFSALKVLVPAVAVASILLFIGYWQFKEPSVTAPSAIINSFTGPISSVMIFETPNTHQTILWYNEATDEEPEQNAV